MKYATATFCGLVLVTGCSINRQDPLTAWGKTDVSMLDYRTDAGQCAVLAATSETGPAMANSAGGIVGHSTGPASSHAMGSASAAPGPQGSASNNLPTLSGGTYRDSAPADFVNRAAMDDRTQEIFEQRARMDLLRSCLETRGYTEFALTEEQRARLSKLGRGTAERRDYLYELGTSPVVLREQAVLRSH